MFQTDLLNLEFLKRKSIKEKFSGENFSLLVVDNVRRFLLELSCKMLTILLHSEHIVTVQPLKSKKQQQELIHSSQVALELTISIDSSQP